MILEVKTFVKQLVYALKSTYFFIQIAVQSKLGVKINDQNLVNCYMRGRGSEIGIKSVTCVIWQAPNLSMPSNLCCQHSLLQIIKRNAQIVYNLVFRGFR